MCCLSATTRRRGTVRQVTPQTAPERIDPGLFDAVCIGETMASFVETDDPRHYVAIAAGAESNVAIGLARLGRRTQWVSRIGDDPLGRIVEESVASAGVTVSATRDPDRVTGVMVKHPSGPAKVSSYYRSESAARLLSPDDLVRVGRAPWVHLTGITPALSESAHALVRSVIDRKSELDCRVSFDVNYRSKLWPDAAAAADTVLPLARDADVVFIGDDEAHILFGTESESALAHLILRRADQELVLKRGPGDASVVTIDDEITVSALATSVVDVTGAGDAFVAGYLAARSDEWPTEARLRLGHFMAARVVGSLEDVPPPLTDEELTLISPAWLSSLWNDGRVSTEILSVESSGHRTSNPTSQEGHRS